MFGRYDALVRFEFEVSNEKNGVGSGGIPRFVISARSSGR